MGMILEEKEALFNIGNQTAQVTHEYNLGNNFVVLGI